MIALLFAIALTAGPTQTHAQLDKAEVDIKPVVMTTEDAAPILAGVAVTVECTARSDGNVEAASFWARPIPGWASERRPWHWCRTAASSLGKATSSSPAPFSSRPKAVPSAFAVAKCHLDTVAMRDCRAHLTGHDKSRY